MGEYESKYQQREESLKGLTSNLLAIQDAAARDKELMMQERERMDAERTKEREEYKAKCDEIQEELTKKLLQEQAASAADKDNFRKEREALEAKRDQEYEEYKAKFAAREQKEQELIQRLEAEQAKAVQDRE